MIFEWPISLIGFVKASIRELYHSCTKYSTIFALLKFFNLKIRHNMTDKYFTKWLKILADVFSNGNTIPMSTYKAKKLTCPISMEHKKINVCLNDL